MQGGGIVTGILFQPAQQRVHVDVRLGAAPARVTLQWPAVTCSIKPGDQLRWSGECAVWTPRDHRFEWPLWVVG